MPTGHRHGTIENLPSLFGPGLPGVRQRRLHLVKSRAAGPASKGHAIMTVSASEALIKAYMAPLRAHASATVETVLGPASGLGRAALSSQKSMLDLLETNEALRSSNGLMEEEAHRFARLLHDSAGQMVFALQLSLADLHRELPQGLKPRLDEFSQLLQQLDRQLRFHAHELYPVVLEDFGLEAAVSDLIDNVRLGTGLTLALDCTLTVRLPRDVESAVYRAVGAALANIVKHARATEVTVRLGLVGARVVCSITDNGVGFVPRPVGSPGAGLGLVGIRDRMRAVNGTVHISSKRGQGTHIRLGAPLPAGKGTNGAERHTRR